ncbi:MAG: hypothetical protein J5518_04875 [Lachnospiraceae bacterium]|nr:hypothetical protein [Lachnospiraceae bacterium]
MTEGSTMSETIKYGKIKEIINKLEGMDLHDRKDGNFKFPVYLRERYKTVDIDALELSVRSQNCLRRAGFLTVYDLMSGIRSMEDLKKIRNCGTNSSREIMENLFLFQYQDTKPEQRGSYLRDVIILNCR